MWHSNPCRLHVKQMLKPFSQFATRHLVVHKATAIYYSSSEILLIKGEKSQQLSRQKCFII